jgi:hypothetical protein
MSLRRVISPFPKRCSCVIEGMKYNDPVITRAGMPGVVIEDRGSGFCVLEN